MEENTFGPDQMAPVPPLTLIRPELPSQRGELVCKTGTGDACKIIEAVAILVQASAEPFTVYAVLLSGESLKVLPNELLFQV